MGEPDDAALAVLSVQQGVGYALHHFEHTVVKVPLGNDLGRGAAVGTPVGHETLEEAEQGVLRQQAPNEHLELQLSLSHLLAIEQAPAGVTAQVRGQ